ncbi:hypothetical protein FBUS_00444 [Fasciolopsis buskii]|uniref:Uncharacterized protein n=1 Tax=Fasciolopsis buskii TaxID=27845 RepID=A0A8E0VMW1_9TREM|nr:hypothetical protein FBUS_00444 [Fasciolopsis buski]
MSLTCLQSNLDRRLVEFNQALAQCIRTQKQRILSCDHRTVSWIVRTLTSLSIRPKWIGQLQCRSSPAENDQTSTEPTPPSIFIDPSIDPILNMEDSAEELTNTENEANLSVRQPNSTLASSLSLRQPRLDSEMESKFYSPYEKILENSVPITVLTALAKEITEVKTMVTSTLNQFDRVFRLSHASKNQTIVEDIRMAVETLEPSTSDSWSPESHVLFDANAAQRNNGNQYVCLNSISSFEQQRISNELRTKEALERRDKLVTERILVEQINKDLEQELESVCREWDTLPQFVSTDHSESWK